MQSNNKKPIVESKLTKNPYLRLRWGHMVERKRPILVWFILFYFLFISALWVVSTMVLSPGTIPHDPVTQASIDNMTRFEYVAGFVRMLLYIIAAIALVLMRKAALYLFMAAVGLDVAFNLWRLSGAGWVNAMGETGTIVAFIGVVLAMALCVYVWLLSEMGRLR